METLSGHLDHNRRGLGPIRLAVTFVDSAELDADEYGYEITFDIAEPRPEHIPAHSTITRRDAMGAIAAIQGYAPLSEKQKAAIRDMDWR